jgi:hypothetical protein
MTASKLTLTADKEIIKRAKKIAAQNGTSVSAMFSRMILAMTHESETKNPPGPLTLKATGLIHIASSEKKDDQLLEEALVKKYGFRK